MEAYFTILLLVALVVFLLLLVKTQVMNRKCFIKNKEKIENYGLFNNNSSEIDIPSILDSLSKKGSNKEIGDIDKHYTYSKGNFERNLLEEATSIINKILNDLNDNYSLRLKLYDIDRIEEIIDKQANKQYIVSFVAYRVDKHATSRLVLCYYKSLNNNISVNYLKSESNSLVGKTTKENTLGPYHHLPAKDSFNKTLLKELPNNNRLDFSRYAPITANFNCEIKENHKLIRLQEPCKYNMHEWDTHGVNKQMKLHKKCSIGNNSDVLPPVNPYFNPTMNGPNINMDIEPRTKL